MIEWNIVKFCSPAEDTLIIVLNGKFHTGVFNAGPDPLSVV